MNKESSSSLYDNQYSSNNNSKQPIGLHSNYISNQNVPQSNELINNTSVSTDEESKSSTTSSSSPIMNNNSNRSSTTTAISTAWPSSFTNYNQSSYPSQSHFNNYYNNFENYYTQKNMLHHHNHNQSNSNLDGRGQFYMPNMNHQYQTSNNILPPADRDSVGTSSSSANSSINSPSPPLILENIRNQLTNNPKLIPSSILTKIGSESSNGLPLKKRRPVPSENKDPLYWEKRRKNNESAKRSREMRRTKEEHVTLRAFYLEQENTQLKSQLCVLREELEKLRLMLYNQNNNNGNH